MSDNMPTGDDEVLRRYHTPALVSRPRMDPWLEHHTTRAPKGYQSGAYYWANLSAREAHRAYRWARAAAITLALILTVDVVRLVLSLVLGGPWL